MRVLLAIASLVVAVLAWVAWGLRGPERTATHHAPPTAAYQLPEPREAEEQVAGKDVLPAERDEPSVARVEVTSVPAQGEDGLPVDVVLVDGENGDVLRRAEATVARGSDVEVAYHLAAPPGYVADTGTSATVKTRASRLAERARVVVPLRREADIRVHVVDGTGRAVQGATLVSVFLGYGFVVESSGGEVGAGAPVASARAEPSGTDGWMRLRGVPHLLEERYRIIVAEDVSRGFADVRLGDFGERHTCEIRLGHPASMYTGFVGLGGGAGGGRAGRGGRRVLHAPATLEVVVLCRDGRLGAGLRVLAGSTEKTTDALGRVTFEQLQPGVYPIVVNDPDFVWSQASVEIREGERRTFVLTESPGWTAHVVLLDSVGRRVPFAEVLVTSGAPVPYLRVVDGIQELAFHTDARGEIELPGMHHAPVQLTFRYGTRLLTVSIEEQTPYRTVELSPPP